MSAECEFHQKWSQIRAKRSNLWDQNSTTAQENKEQNSLHLVTSQNPTSNRQNQGESITHASTRFFMVLTVVAVLFYAWSLIKDIICVAAVSFIVIGVLRST